MKVTVVIGSLYGIRHELDLTAIAPCDLLTNHQIGQLTQPQGFPKVYNRLLNAAFAEDACQYAFLINDDARPVGPCLRATLDVMQGDPTIGVAFPVEAWTEPGHGWVTAMPFTGEKRSISGALSDEPIEQVFAGFALACISRAAWEAVGPMDESFGLAYCEDLDWSIRCWKAGFRVVNVRSHYFEHERGGTCGRLVAGGLISPMVPYEAAKRCKEKWPFLWGEMSPEQTLALLKEQSTQTQRAVRTASNQ